MEVEDDVPFAVASLRSTGIGGVALVEVVPVGRGEEEGGACGWRERGGVGRLGVANLWSFGILVRVCVCVCVCVCVHVCACG